MGPTFFQQKCAKKTHSNHRYTHDRRHLSSGGGGLPPDRTPLYRSNGKGTEFLRANSKKTRPVQSMDVHMLLCHR